MFSENHAIYKSTQAGSILLVAVDSKLRVYLIFLIKCIKYHEFDEKYNILNNFTDAVHI